MAIRFVIDSASDISPAEAKDLGLVYIPLTVAFDDEEYYDSVTLTHKQFYEKLIESDTLPKTSQISVGRFIDVFQEVVDEGDTVVAIIVSSSLSGTYQSACIAAQDFPGKVHVVDSQNVCIGERLLVMRALELQKEGKSLEEILECLEEEKKDIRVLAVLDTLEYLKKGGRISSAVALAGGLLSIKPVVGVQNGEVVMVGKARGSKKGNNLLRTLIDSGKGVDYEKPYCAAYSGLSDLLLKKYIEDNEDLWKVNDKELPITTIGCVIGTHVGPNAIGVAFFEKR